MSAEPVQEMQVQEPARRSKLRLGLSPWLLSCLGGGGLLIAALLAWGYWELGSFANIAAYANGERLLVDPKVLSFGSAPRGQERVLQVTFRNYVGKSITILGARSKCGCIGLEQEYPLRLANGSQRDVTIRVWPTGDGPRFEQDVEFFTDDAANPVIAVSIRGQITN